MSQKYSIAEARSHLATIVEQAVAGVEVELTRRGRPVAVVISRSQLDRLRGRRRDFSGAYRSFLEKFSLDEIGLDVALAGARDRTNGRKVAL